MLRKFAFSAVVTLMALGQVSAATAETTGVDSNRAALGLPVQARVGTCVAGAGCGVNGKSENLASGGAVAVGVLALAAAGAGVYAGVHNGHEHTSAPTSPVSP